MYVWKVFPPFLVSAVFKQFFPLVSTTPYFVEESLAIQVSREPAKSLVHSRSAPELLWVPVVRKVVLGYNVAENSSTADIMTYIHTCMMLAYALYSPLKEAKAIVINCWYLISWIDPQ